MGLTQPKLRDNRAKTLCTFKKNAHTGKEEENSMDHTNSQHDNFLIDN